MGEFPQYLSSKEIYEKKRVIPGKPRGGEIIDLTYWMPPVFVETWAYSIANKPHLIPYLINPEVKELSGFFGDLWNGIKKLGQSVWSFTKDNIWLVAPAVAGGVAYAVSEDVREHPEYVLGPLGVYYLGYALYKWGKKTPDEPIKQGVAQLQNPPPQVAEEVKNAVEKSDVLKDLVKLGADVAGTLLAQKIIAESQKRGQSPQETVEQGFAYVTRWAPEFRKMGLVTPEQALAAVFQATGGAPPDPNQDPWELLQIRPFHETTTDKIGEFFRKYGWIVATAVIGLVLLKEKK